MLWTLDLVNYLFVSLVVFQEFSLILSTETNSSVFSFCLTFSVSMKLGGTVIYSGLEGLSLCECPYTVHVPSGFSGSAGSDTSTNHLFPQGVLAAIALVQSGVGGGVARKRARCELGLLLCSVAINTLFGVQWGPRLLEQNPWGSGPSCLSSL